MDTFTALADPNRRRMIEMLATQGQLSSSDIGGHFDISPPAVSQHLKVLREAGLVKMEKRAQQRIYSINPEGLTDMEQWISQLRQFWNNQFDALERFLEADADKPKS
jgi:DNA-binding transcriptional ArsR family regulator